MTAPSPLRTLDRRPEASTFLVERIVRDVLEGRIRIPTWQRELKWDRDDALQLLDSLHRGYPISTLLFWKRSAAPERVRFASIEIQAPARADALFVVDGQQRITTLVRVLAGAPTDPFALVFDTHTQRLMPAARSANPDLLPLTEILDSRRLIRWLAAHPEADHDAAIELGSRVREYQVPVYTVETDDEAVVRDVFERTNHSGKGLRAHEIFDGRFRGLDGARPEGLRDVVAAVSELGFGRIDEPTLHTALLGLDHTDPSRVDTAAWSATEAREALDALQAAARRAVVFLTQDAGIPHVDLLPYSLPFLVLVRFFRHHPDPAPRSRTLLGRWLWRGAVGGLHTGAQIGTRAHLSAVDGHEHASVQRLLALVDEARRNDAPPVAAHFRRQTARARVAMVALFSLGPRSFSDGERISPGDARLTRISSEASSHSLGSFVFAPAHPPELVEAIARCDDAEVYASHAIDEVALHAIRAGDIPGFVHARELLLDVLVSSFVRGKLAWDLGDRPPLSVLWGDADEEDTQGPET